MTGFPLLLDLRDRPVLVVGAGAVGTRRALALAAAGARVRVVAPQPSEALTGVEIERREYRVDDLDGVWLVLACTSDPEVNAAVAAAARDRQIFCVRADDASGGTARSFAADTRRSRSIPMLSLCRRAVISI